jgi:hypothetical protein
MAHLVPTSPSPTPPTRPSKPPRPDLLLPTGSTTRLEHGALTNFGFAILSVVDRDGSHLELSAPL